MSKLQLTASHTQRVTRLYRRSLKNLMNWVVWRDLWIEKGFELRAEFDKNKNVSDPRIIEKLVSDGEAKLAELQHPDPYTSASPPCPTAILRENGLLRSRCIFFLASHNFGVARRRVTVPHMPGGSKYMRHPFNSQGFPPEVRRARFSRG